MLLFGYTTSFHHGSISDAIGHLYQVLNDSALFDVEYKRQLLYWAAEQLRGEFTEQTWQAFWRTGVEGRSAKEVGAELGMTVGTIYHYKSRVMARLRRKIEQVQGEA